MYISGSKFIYQNDFELSHSCKYNHSMDFHLHDDFEIYLSIRGGQFYTIGDKVYEIQPGDLFLISANEAHKSVGQKNMPYERYLITFKTNLILNYCTEDTDLLSCFTKKPLNHSHKIHLSKEKENELIHYYKLIKDCSGFGGDVLKISYFLQLIVFINNVYLETEKVEINNNLRIKPIIDYINLYLTKELKLDDLEKEFHLNKYYLCDIFKRYTGTTINKYIVARRISEAKKLLVQGLPVSEVCSRTGFNDYSHFIRTFTKIVGLSPKKYGNAGKDIR